MSKSPMHRMTWTFHISSHLQNKSSKCNRRSIAMWPCCSYLKHKMRKSLQCKIGCKKLDFNLQSQYCPTCLTQQADRGCAVTTCQMDYTIGRWYSVSTKQRCEDVLYQQFHKPLVSRQRISPRRLHLCVIQSRILILDYTKWLHSPEESRSWVHSLITLIH